MASPRVIDAKASPEPLTPAEKAQLAFRNTFGAHAIGNRLLVAGFHQLFDNPSEWPGGMDGYGKRVGSRMGLLASNNAIRLSTDVAFRLDPRYDRCDCSGF